MDGRVVSVNVGGVGTIGRGSAAVRSAFHKSPVDGAVAIGPEGLAGNAVGDPRVHGGPRKAVYAYPSEHYECWRTILDPSAPLPWGSFGENLTVSGLSEADLRPGDVLAVGDAELIVTQPRHPCFKLALYHDRPSLIAEFEAADRPGFYLGVRRPGSVQRGDAIRRIDGPTEGATILDVYRA